MTLRITSNADLEEGMAALAALHPHWEALVARTGLPPLRLREGGFSGLASIIVSQQLSVASARAVWTRFSSVFVPLTPERFLAASDDDMRLSGLSRPKQRALAALAAALVEKRLVLEALQDMTAEDVHLALTAISGIGPWTADVYLLFCLGHRDGFAAGDLAVQEAARHAFGLPARPKAGELAAMAEAWRPWRGVAARLLWADYAVLKKREGIDA
ncbi:MULTISPECIES: DNA-3-methyladenine glycosylase [unclassified Bosea (in: a-proteobacteria)]|uniref:DNA-3-methyladenine glycosylase family protein n=1 Tax=unclassified Bosea (in: a-proteobacteria) TaxID=2653178 RepID=UPI0009545CA9|nr:MULTISPECIES: DNA-3-methyladenine glycosylase [unclassified Bosea (in: a-proteobacteria)]TAJ28211.1 MAG: DNA-3-methyladenine glycosylase 2 family protein [Bosea sp. (in: a-proteobacteria)]SIR38639.1 DNA-3-methyladenine glycosylase II [Bosea sp. TND4EK4]